MVLTHGHLRFLALENRLGPTARSLRLAPARTTSMPWTSASGSCTGPSAPGAMARWRDGATARARDVGVGAARCFQKGLSPCGWLRNPKIATTKLQKWLKPPGVSMTLKKWLVITQQNVVIYPVLKGHGDSRWVFAGESNHPKAS